MPQIKVFGPLGMEVWLDHQKYVLDRFQVIDNGYECAVWKTQCAECGTVMEIFTQPNRIDTLPRRRRCARHHAPGVRVQPRIFRPLI